MTDPIRARLDDWQAISKAEYGDALRAVLDLCDEASPMGWGHTQFYVADVRRVIAEHLGVTDA